MYLLQLCLYIHTPDIQAKVASEKRKRRYYSNAGMLGLAVYTLISSCCYALAACGVRRVVDSLRHSNAEYRSTSRELGYNGSAQCRPQVSFQN